MGPRNSRLRGLASRKLTATAVMAGLFTSTLCGAGQLDSVVPGRWHAFPNSRLESVAVNTRAFAVIHAWGSGVYDTDREQLVVWGGGHSDYDGNEVYTFGPLTSDAPRWTRLTEPSSPPANNTPRGADGRPVSRHTYNLLTYLPAPLNMMMSCAIGSQTSNGNAGPGVDFFNFTINGRTGQPWRAGPNAPLNGFPGGFCIYNPLTQSVWYQPTGGSAPRLQEYRLATNSWTSYPVDVSEDRDPTAAIDTRRNLMVTVGRPLDTNTTRYSVLLYDLNTPSAQPIKIVTSGNKAIENARFPGFVYDPVNDQFIGWNGGSAIFSLKAPANPKTGTWVWSQFQLDAGNTVIPTSVAGIRVSGREIGTFGRFRYVPSQQGVIVVNAADESVFFFKIPGGSGGRLPAVNISADPTNVSAGGTSTLTWSTTNATSCSAAGAWSGVKPTAGSEASGPINSTSNFILTCDNGAGGVGSGSVTVSTAQAIPAPTVDLNATPESVDPGGPVTLDWTTTTAASCTASGGWSGPKSTSGSQNVASVSQGTSFVLTCQGTGGSGSDAVTVNIGTSSPGTPGGPSLDLSAETRSVAPGGSVRLTWSSSGTNSCTASNAWAGSRSVSGAQMVTPTGSSSTYVLSCSGVGGSVERNVTVLVTSAAAPTQPTAAPAKKKGGGGAMTLSTLLMLLGVLAARHMSRRIRAQ